MAKIINFAPTGTQTTRQNSNAPLSQNEIVEEVHSVFEEGLITMVHIHARDEELKNTYKVEFYAPIIEGIRKHCPHLCICVSLSGRYFSEVDKRSEVLSLKPDMGSLTMSSLNFPSGASVNSGETIIELVENMDKWGVIPEVECFDYGMVNYTKYLMNKGILKPPYYVNMIFGNLFSSQIDDPNIVKKPFDNAVVCYGGIGKVQLKANLLGLVYADGVRMGLEDNLYIKDKEKATNLQLLKRLKTIMDEMGENVMSTLDFLSLGYGNRKLVGIGKK
jgi:3-keto-5-aminohexanoate cleavage enzyme